VAGLGGVQRRDGSFAYYMSEAIICNDLKATGAFLQAGCEAARA
jgi:unsaturated rhamnogalacturonyl hydrolase